MYLQLCALAIAQCAITYPGLPYLARTFLINYHIVKCYPGLDVLARVHFSVIMAASRSYAGYGTFLNGFVCSCM